MRNLDFLRSLPEGVSMKEVGARLYEALTDVQAAQQTIAQQVNANPEGHPLPPPAVDGLTVTGQNGQFHLQIQHAAEFYRGVNYHAEYADNPSFQNPRSIDMGASREHTTFLGNGTYYWRAFASYASSAAGPPAYHGGAHSPQPVGGGGSIGGPAFLAPQGSGTGAPGEGLSGPGPIAFRTSTGRPPIRGESVASGGSSGGSLTPSPATGLPEGMASLAGSAGSAAVTQFVSVTQSQLATLAATLSNANTGMLVYVSDYDHTLRWTGSGWTFASGERSGFVEAFLVDPSPATGWQLCDGSAAITYLKADGTTGSLTVPNLTGSPSYLKFGAAVTGINAPVAPTLTMNPYTPAGTVSQPTLTMNAYTPTGTVSQPTFAGSALGTHQHQQTIRAAGANLLCMNAPFGTAGGALTMVGQYTGAVVTLTNQFTDLVSATSAGTPAGTVSQPTFSGNAATLTGTVSQPTFSGTPATLTGTISTTAEPQNIVARPWFRR